MCEGLMDKPNWGQGGVRLRVGDGGWSGRGEWWGEMETTILE